MCFFYHPDFFYNLQSVETVYIITHLGLQRYWNSHLGPHKKKYNPLTAVRIHLYILKRFVDITSSVSFEPNSCQPATILLPSLRLSLVTGLNHHAKVRSRKTSFCRLSRNIENNSLFTFESCKNPKRSNLNQFWIINLLLFM